MENIFDTKTTKDLIAFVKLSLPTFETRLREDTEDKKVWGLVYNELVSTIKDTIELQEYISQEMAAKLARITSLASTLHDRDYAVKELVDGREVKRHRTQEERYELNRELQNSIFVFQNYLDKIKAEHQIERKIEPKVEPKVEPKLAPKEEPTRQQRFRTIPTVEKAIKPSARLEDTQVVLAAHSTAAVPRSTIDLDDPMIIPFEKAKRKEQPKGVEPIIPRKPQNDNTQRFATTNNQQRTATNRTEFKRDVDDTRKFTPIDIPLNSNARRMKEPVTEQEKMEYIANIIGNRIEKLRQEEMFSPHRYLFDERDMNQKPYWTSRGPRDIRAKERMASNFIRTFAGYSSRLFKLFHHVMEYLDHEYEYVRDIHTIERIYKYIDSISRGCSELNKLYRNVENFGMMEQALTEAEGIIEGLEMYFYEQEIPKSMKKS